LRKRIDCPQKRVSEASLVVGVTGEFQLFNRSRRRSRSREFCLVTQRFRSVGHVLNCCVPAKGFEHENDDRTIKEQRRGPRTPHRRSRTRSARTAICSADQQPPEPCPHCPCFARGFAVTVSPQQPDRTLRRMEPQIQERVTFLETFNAGKFYEEGAVIRGPLGAL
jgi:hypothetical protein